MSGGSATSDEKGPIADTERDAVFSMWRRASKTTVVRGENHLGSLFAVMVIIWFPAVTIALPSGVTLTGTDVLLFRAKDAKMN